MPEEPDDRQFTSVELVGTLRRISDELEEIAIALEELVPPESDEQ